MALWQVLSIAGVGTVGGVSFLAIVWFFFIRPTQTAVTNAPKQESGDSGVDKPTAKDQAVLFHRKVRRILASRPGAGDLPRLLQMAAEEAREGLCEEEEEYEEPCLISNDFSSLTCKGLLGCGGFGRVQLVEEQGLFAYKSIPKCQLEKTKSLSSLISEKSVLAAVNICPSPFLVSYYGCCQTPSYVYFKMEALLGGELFYTVKQNSLTGKEDHARYFLACALMGVQHLHQLRVVLRSLKPEDCALDSVGRLKLIDFGLSKFIMGKTYTTCGTPDYFAPEIISSQGHSFPVDWWCAGVMLFELLTGHAPFESDYPMQIYAKVVKGIGKVTFPSSMNSKAKELIRSLCHSDDSKRLPEAQGFEALQRHGFFKGIDWPGLAQLKPPFAPSQGEVLKKFGASEDELPPGFDKAGGPDWAEEFGPLGEMDDIPVDSE